TVERVDKDSPSGFIPYLVTQTSSDSTCGRQTTLLYSPLTQQTLLGTVLELPSDARNVDVRVADKAMEVPKQPLTASVAKFPLRPPPRARAPSTAHSDRECPTCRRAHLEIEPLIEKHLANVDYIRLDLPLFEHHEWALPAAMAARAIHQEAPKEYWKFVNYVY